MTPVKQVNDHVTAEQAKSRANGSLFFIGFGTLWAYVGLRQTQEATPLSLSLLVGLAGLLLGGALLLFRRAKTLPHVPPSGEDELRTQRMFAAVNIIQWVSIGTAIAIFAILHLPEYVMPAICIIVGLHLFPLATAFRYPQHNVTGALLVAWGLGCLLILPRARLSGLTALGTGAILLVSAAITLGKTLGGAPNPLETANARG